MSPVALCPPPSLLARPLAPLPSSLGPRPSSFAVHPAVKCCPDPVLIKIMSLLGTGFDVASQAEIQLALDVNTAPEHIIFANPCKPKTHIAYSRDKHIKLMTFDNAAELIKVKEVFPDAEVRGW